MSQIRFLGWCLQSGSPNRLSCRIQALLLSLLLLGCCGNSATAFLEENAFNHLVAQCEMGPRNPGSPGHESCLVYLQKVLSENGGRVRLQSFSHPLPISFELPDSASQATQPGAVVPGPADEMRDYSLTNVIADFGPDRSGGLLLGAHWDTRPWSDHDPDSTQWMKPIIGANDGASGVALLLALADQFKREPPPIPVTMVFFDGEDSGRHNRVDEWSIGAQRFSAQLSSQTLGHMPEMALVLDMVASKSMVLAVETQCRQLFGPMAELIDQLAIEVGVNGYTPVPTPPLTDDHVPLIRAGIPTLLLIDFRDPYWHTQRDIPENCSKTNLGQVGRLLERLIFGGYFR